MATESVPDLALDLPATAQGLRSCLASIGEACARRNLPPEMRSRLEIVVEELYSNTIKYGYGGESTRPVRVRLLCATPVELVYEDEAPPFDPTAWLAQEPGQTPPPRDVVGRKGIALALGLARSARYERLRSGNRVRLRFG
jgi:anti-sigma regulatory factor (Ser/Thr protein kinase)